METERLVVRRFVSGDWTDLHAMLSDARVVRYEPYPPQSEAQCKRLAAERAASADFWAVCLKDGGHLIGNVYLAEGEQACWALGYVFAWAHQGRGYATEAAGALLRWAFAHGAHRIWAECNPENGPSWRLLERLGFRREGHLRQNVYFHCAQDGAPLWQDTFVYGLLRGDLDG